MSEMSEIDGKVTQNVSLSVIFWTFLTKITLYSRVFVAVILVIFGTFATGHLAEWGVIFCTFCFLTSGFCRIFDHFSVLSCPRNHGLGLEKSRKLVGFIGGLEPKTRFCHLGTYRSPKVSLRSQHSVKYSVFYTLGCPKTDLRDLYRPKVSIQLCLLPRDNAGFTSHLEVKRDQKHTKNTV